MEAIEKIKAPDSKEALLRFLGMVTYSSRHIKNLSSEADNSRRLTRHDTEWIWTRKEEDDFESIKSLVTNIKEQSYFDVSQPITLECDASLTGLGAAVYQNDKIMECASRTLTKTEKNYTQIEKELLTIVFGCTRFDRILTGNQSITIKTDHKSLSQSSQNC